MKMKGIVLAGGTGSRLLPLTKIINKNLLPVGEKPMIQHCIEKLVNSEIRDIMIISGKEHIGSMAKFLGSGAEFNADFTLRIQDNPGGIAQALGLAKTFSNGSKICVILGDNIFGDSLNYYIKEYFQQKVGARILLKRVKDPERFGNPRFDGYGNIIEIIEKPKVPASNYAITGIYFYDEKVFDIISILKPSKRMELEISDVNIKYLELNELKHSVLVDFWIDAGTHETLKAANILVNDPYNKNNLTEFANSYRR